MDYVVGLIYNVTQDQSVLRLIIIGLAALTVMALTLGLGFMLVSLTDPLRIRINKLIHNTGQGDSVMDRTASHHHFLYDEDDGSPRYHTRKRLAHAGFRAENAVTDYFAIRLLSAFLFPVITLFVMRFIPELETRQALLLLIASLAVGLLLPSFILDQMIASRKKRLRDGFPDALDMLVVCVEAGLGLQSALQRVAEELNVSHPDLAEELSLVNTEIRMGVERMAALRNMAYRTGLDDIRGLVTSLDQSMRFGTNIADTLRVYSEEFRDKRLQKAEESAAKLSTKMIFPLTLCMWPAFFLIMVGPALLGVLEMIGRS
ncbi:MAG: type II secretion system F family protein [Amphritea sp.]|nr:type II secretion system F family protein [Amphritea sp.]